MPRRRHSVAHDERMMVEFWGGVADGELREIPDDSTPGGMWKFATPAGPPAISYPDQPTQAIRLRVALYRLDVERRRLVYAGEESGR